MQRLAGDLVEGVLLLVAVLAPVSRRARSSARRRSGSARSGCPRTSGRAPGCSATRRIIGSSWAGKRSELEIAAVSTPSGRGRRPGARAGRRSAAGPPGAAPRDRRASSSSRASQEVVGDAVVDLLEGLLRHQRPCDRPRCWPRRGSACSARSGRWRHGRRCRRRDACRWTRRRRPVTTRSSPSPAPGTMRTAPQLPVPSRVFLRWKEMKRASERRSSGESPRRDSFWRSSSSTPGSKISIPRSSSRSSAHLPRGLDGFDPLLLRVLFLLGRRWNRRGPAPTEAGSGLRGERPARRCRRPAAPLPLPPAGVSTTAPKGFWTGTSAPLRRPTSEPKGAPHAGVVAGRARRRVRGRRGAAARTGLRLSDLGRARRCGHKASVRPARRGRPGDRAF